MPIWVLSALVTIVVWTLLVLLKLANVIGMNAPAVATGIIWLSVPVGFIALLAIIWVKKKSSRIITVYSDVVWLLIGIAGRKFVGYKGIVDTILWPLAIVCAWYLAGKKEEHPSGCSQFISPYCVDGSCPKALREEYPEYGLPKVECEECEHFTKKCKDCLFHGTEDCEKGIETS